MKNGRKTWGFCLVSISFTLSSDFLHAVKSYMGPPALFPIGRKVCCEFLSP
jgi:hypothetical protein